MIAPTTRAPLWNKSTARYLTPANGAAPSSSEPPAPATLPDAKVLGKLGLQPPPTDPRLLAAYLAKDDLADGSTDADNFARGIRRAVRLDFAYAAKLHELANKPWVEWVGEHFKAGYECYRRYHRAAELQLGLATRNLPLLANENQARALGAFRKHEQFWAAIGKSFTTGFPAAPEIQVKMRAALGLSQEPALGVVPQSAATTPRIKLHRLLGRIMDATPAEDATVGRALELIREAMSLLETGTR